MSGAERDSLPRTGEAERDSLPRTGEAERDSLPRTGEAERDSLPRTGEAERGSLPRMTEAERGYLLLCADLGDGKKPLTLAQMQRLRSSVLARSAAQAGAEAEAKAQAELDRPFSLKDLTALGCDSAFSTRVLELLERKRELEQYLCLAAERGIYPLTRISSGYPPRLRRLGRLAPTVLFYRGDLRLLERRAVALVGSRELTAAGAAFARKVGRLAAAEGAVLVSGNARGADRTAQEACMEAGGAVIAVLPDGISEHAPRDERMLCLCEWGWHLPMTAYRALERNRLIHAMAEKTFVAQSRLVGGTWRGSEENLRRGWSPLFVHDDGSPGCTALISMGGAAVRLETLDSLAQPAMAQSAMRQLPLCLEGAE